MIIIIILFVLDTLDHS